MAPSIDDRWHHGQSSFLTAMCRDHGLQPAQVALAWCHSVAPVTSTIVGATKVSQLEQNAAAADLDLDPELLNAVESIFAS